VLLWGEAEDPSFGVLYLLPPLFEGGQDCSAASSNSDAAG